MKTKITHLTSAHPRYDTRIFIKMCSSLAANKNYEVSLVVADDKGDEVKNDVKIFDVCKKNGRLNRILKTTKNVYKKALELNSDIYHIHDPELIFIGLKLKKLGKKVIFDVHENVSLQILDKVYIHKMLRKLISKIYRMYEVKSLKNFDVLVLAEYSYESYYKELNNKIEIILNMPDLQPLEQFVSKERNKNEIFYIGGISNDRGFKVTVEALKLLKSRSTDFFMHFIGPYSKDLIDSINFDKIENNIKLYGRMPLYEGLEYSKKAKVGLSILKPIGNYKSSYSTKVFEYMALELPVVTSNFKLYKDVVEKYNCGICVDPLNPKEIADAIEYIMTHPIEAKIMGENGKKAVIEKYNWKLEEAKLFKVYEELIK
ncbi:MAG: glycosyltransferase family 4 protein [Sulfurovaceae bacterium]|nr:glycosyltransferase family 4 protein [Sulfurovaceae bacterium]